MGNASIFPSENDQASIAQVLILLWMSIAALLLLVSTEAQKLRVQRTYSKVKLRWFLTPKDHE